MSLPVNSNAAPEGLHTVGSLLRGNDLPRLECSILLAHLLGVRRESVLAHPERRLNLEQQLQYDRLQQRRFAGEPIAYVVGKREFFGLEFRVTPDVLIPRPETELLVEAALERIPHGSRGRLLDLGTGSGAVAIAMATVRPLLQIDAIDVSAAALDVAAANAAALGAANIRWAVSDWYAMCGDRTYDVIVSNPPYIAGNDPHLGEGDLRFEPSVALSPGGDGLRAIRAIVLGAGEHLNEGGWLMLEHGYDQAAKCRMLLEGAGFIDIESLRDLAGIERVTGGRLQ